MENPQPTSSAPSRRERKYPSLKDRVLALTMSSAGFLGGEKVAEAQSMPVRPDTHIVQTAPRQESTPMNRREIAQYAGEFIRDTRRLASSEQVDGMRSLLVMQQLRFYLHIPGEVEQLRSDRPELNGSQAIFFDTDHVYACSVVSTDARFGATHALSETTRFFRSESMPVGRVLRHVVIDTGYGELTSVNNVHAIAQLLRETDRPGTVIREEHPTILSDVPGADSEAHLRATSRVFGVRFTKYETWRIPPDHPGTPGDVHNPSAFINPEQFRVHLEADIVELLPGVESAIESDLRTHH